MSDKNEKKEAAEPPVLQGADVWGLTEYVSGEPAEATEIRNRVAQLRAKITLNAPSRAAWVREALDVLDEIAAVIPALIIRKDEANSVALHYAELRGGWVILRERRKHLLMVPWECPWNDLIARLFRVEEPS